MRLMLACMRCVEASLDDEMLAQAMMHVELCDDGRYEVTCPAGHTTVTVLQP
jgi:hypothetical protein